MNPVKLAVRKIIELVLRGGDIDGRFSDPSAMHKGSAAHRKIQKAAGEGYIKEVSLKHETIIDVIPVIVHGRADGIITTPDGTIIIDEIKTTTLPLDYIYTHHNEHLGQGKVYAHMYLKTLENPPESVTVQLTYYQLESEETRQHRWSFTAEELAQFFADLLHKYGRWLRFEREWKITRNESIALTSFPFETYRKGQRELAVAVYRVISAGKKLYAQAPTGIGKTLSALFPGVKALGEDKAEKIFYLTAKTVTRAVAEDAIRLMTAKGLRLKSVTLRAKDKICPNHECTCNPDFCPRAKGHYDRINDAVMDLLENDDLITPEVTQEYADKHCVCPHEYALEISLWCDLIIGDYNHVFDPSVYLRRFFGPGTAADENGDYVFLIDEAHNLADRVRDMYTADIRKGAFGHILRQIRGRDTITSALRKTLKQICEYMKELRETIAGVSPVNEGRNPKSASHVSKEKDTQLDKLMASFTVAAGEWLAANKTNPADIFGEILELYFKVSHFILISDLYDHHYTTIAEAYGSDITITLFCLDPSDIIAAGLKRGKSSILFSATLAPLGYYREILGGKPEDLTVSLPSPFDPNRLLTLIHRGISTKYVHRESSYMPIAQVIHAAICNKKGNYLVFFPSFEYMHKVYELFCEAHPQFITLPQQSTMTEEERADFLARFDADNHETLIGFAVLGGIFSEGIDLKGDRLIGTIIVSVGLPKISLRSDQIRDYFNQLNGQGYDYAYVYPGMNKVLQAAGRVIRTESDAGIVLLIDDRFATAKYLGLFPGHWTNMQCLHNLGEIDSCIQGFWKQP